MKKLQERLRDVSQQKQSEAWRRTDGGQDLSIGAMLADEAATALDTLEAEVARLREWERVANERLELCNEAIQQRDQAVYVLEGAGFRRCDIPACNCNSWHQIGGFKARFDEIQEVVEQAGYSTNGRVLLDAVKQMAKDAATPLSAQEDVVERFTPNEIIMLLHFYCSAAPFDRIHAPACQAAVQRFLAAGWIEPSNKSGNQYHTTAAGTVMVNAICRITSTDRERGLEEAALTRALLWSAFVELNAIRARDGAPKGVSEDYFRQLVDAISNELGDDCAPWPRDEWKPLLERSLKRSQEKG